MIFGRRFVLNTMAISAWNPLSLKGQYWETGNIIYQKSDAETPAEALQRLRELTTGLRDAASLAEVGDLDAVRSTLETATERALRVEGSRILDTIDYTEDAATAARARDTFSRAMASYETVDRAMLSLETPSSAVLGQAISALTASGLIFLFPMAAVKSAVDRTAPSLTYDTGLAVVANLEDCVAALDDLLKLAADLLPETPR